MISEDLRKSLDEKARDFSFSARRERFEKRNAREYVSNDELLSLMENIDFESTMVRLGLDVQRGAGDEYIGYCPDHVLHNNGVPQHEKKWNINSRNGRSICWTSGHGSNLVKIAQYLLGCSTEREAYDILRNGREFRVKNAIDRAMEQPQRREEPQDEEKLQASLAEAMPFLEKGELPDRCLEYFAKDEIRKDTLEQFGVSFCDAGRYRDRAIVPFLGREQELVGFIAIDTLGKERWAETRANFHYSTDHSVPLEELRELYLKKYRKTLYAPGFQSRLHLYGMFEKQDFGTPEYLVLVEGERDCLKLMQEGIPCVAVHGTSVKEEQILLLKSSGVLGNLKELFLGFDMDDAGDRACEKAMKRFQGEVDRIYVLEFPDGRDPKKFRREELLGFIDRSRRENITERRRR